MKTLIQNFKIIFILTIVLFSVNYAFAVWSDPTANPTADNAPTPINVSSVSQTKTGPFWADGGLFTGAGGYFGGSVGIGPTEPKERFQIGDQWTFHDGGWKIISRNSYFDGSNDRRIVDGEAAAMAFTSAGDILFRTAPFGAAETVLDSGGIETWLSGTPPLIVKNNGNIGIGTASPGAKLHIGGTAGTDGIMFPDGTLQTTASVAAVPFVYDYGSGSSPTLRSSPIMAYGRQVSLGSNSGARISNLPFSSASSYSCVASANTANGGGGGWGPFAGGPDQNTGLVGCYIESASSIWLHNTDDQPRVVNWIAIGY